MQSAVDMRAGFEAEDKAETKQKGGLQLYDEDDPKTAKLKQQKEREAAKLAEKKAADVHKMTEVYS
eukprot:3889210-Pyramimonas_sp.AAC.1